MNHPSYSPDLAPSNYFLIRNLKYHLCGTWFTDDESDDRCRGMGWESKQIIIFLGHKQLRRKVEKMHWCCRTICRKTTVSYIYIYIFWNVGSFSGKNSKMDSRPAMSVGVYTAWPERTRTGFVRCRTALCAKSYKIKKNKPTTTAAAVSRSNIAQHLWWLDGPRQVWLATDSLLRLCRPRPGLGH